MPIQSGFVRVKKVISDKTKYFWGDKSEIEGQVIECWERNKYGDCLRYVKDKGLVSIEACDVDLFINRSNIDPTSTLLGLLQAMMAVGRGRG